MAEFFATFDIPLRWGDLDAQGHVNNAVILDYLQEARAGLLRRGENRHMLGGGVVVTGHQVEYLRPIGFVGGSVQVRIGVTRVGASRFSMGYEVVQGDEVCVRAWSDLCPFDFTTQRPRLLTDAEREAYRQMPAVVDGFRRLTAPHLLGRGHAYELTVRWSDLDAYGHVNNVKYFDYVQEARVAMSLESTDVALDGSAGLWFVVRQDIDHLAQMDSRAEPFVVRTAPVAVGGSSSTYACEVTDPLRVNEHGHPMVMARARTIVVHADATGRPQPIPDEVRASLEGSLITGH